MAAKQTSHARQSYHGPVQLARSIQRPAGSRRQVHDRRTRRQDRHPGARSPARNVRFTRAHDQITRHAHDAVRHPAAGRRIRPGHARLREQFGLLSVGRPVRALERDLGHDHARVPDTRSRKQSDVRDAGEQREHVRPHGRGPLRAGAAEHHRESREQPRALEPRVPALHRPFTLQPVHQRGGRRRRPPARHAGSRQPPPVIPVTRGALEGVREHDGLAQRPAHARAEAQGGLDVRLGGGGEPRARPSPPPPPRHGHDVRGSDRPADVGVLLRRVRGVFDRRAEQGVQAGVSTSRRPRRGQRIGNRGPASLGDRRHDEQHFSWHVEQLAQQRRLQKLQPGKLTVDGAGPAQPRDRHSPGARPDGPAPFARLHLRAHAVVAVLAPPSQRHLARHRYTGNDQRWWAIQPRRARVEGARQDCQRRADHGSRHRPRYAYDGR